jgi:hypothetical protein
MVVRSDGSWLRKGNASKMGADKGNGNAGKIRWELLKGRETLVRSDGSC